MTIYITTDIKTEAMSLEINLKILNKLHESGFKGLYYHTNEDGYFVILIDHSDCERKHMGVIDSNKEKAKSIFAPYLVDFEINVDKVGRFAFPPRQCSSYVDRLSAELTSASTSQTVPRSTGQYILILNRRLKAMYQREKNRIKMRGWTNQIAAFSDIYDDSDDGVFGDFGDMGYFEKTYEFQQLYHKYEAQIVDNYKLYCTEYSKNPNNTDLFSACLDIIPTPAVIRSDITENDEGQCSCVVLSFKPLLASQRQRSKITQFHASLIGKKILELLGVQLTLQTRFAYDVMGQITNFSITLVGLTIAYQPGNITAFINDVKRALYETALESNYQFEVINIKEEPSPPPEPAPAQSETKIVPRVVDHDAGSTTAAASEDHSTTPPVLIPGLKLIEKNEGQSRFSVEPVLLDRLANDLELRQKCMNGEVLKTELFELTDSETQQFKPIVFRNGGECKSEDIRTALIRLAGILQNNFNTRQLMQAKIVTQIDFTILADGGVKLSFDYELPPRTVCSPAHNVSQLVQTSKNTDSDSAQSTAVTDQSTNSRVLDSGIVMGGLIENKIYFVVHRRLAPYLVQYPDIRKKCIAKTISSIEFEYEEIDSNTSIHIATRMNRANQPYNTILVQALTLIATEIENNDTFAKNIEKGVIEEITFTINEDDTINLKTQIKVTAEKSSPIHAAGNAHDEIVKQAKEILNSDEKHIFIQSLENRDYGQALRRACTGNDDIAVKLIELLLKYKSVLEFVNEQAGVNKYSALHHAACKKNAEAYDLLVRNGADSNLAGTGGVTPAKLAQDNGLITSGNSSATLTTI